MSSPEPAQAFIALGSNLGDRVGHLQAAVSALAATRGIEVNAISPVYENAAQTSVPGDEQPPYLNAVVAVSTVLTPRALVDRLLAIELARGRVRSGTNRWAARTLDCDLLVYGEATIDEDGLTVPHPRMAARRFVLRPLSDLAPSLRVPAPVLRSVSGLLESCPDDSTLEPTAGSLRIPGQAVHGQAELWPESQGEHPPRENVHLPGELRYIVVEGVIGVGKTTLARELSTRFGASLVLEEFEENPFLARFYEDRPRWAFQTQLAFLASRFRQQQALAKRDLFHDLLVSDYAFDKDRIFARLNLSGDELQLYETMYTIMQPSVPRPDLVVYLQASTECIMERIHRRGRDFEANMDSGYIQALGDAYNAYFFHYSSTPLLIVNANRLDFVRNSADLEELFRQIARIRRSGTTYFSPVRPL